MVVRYKILDTNLFCLDPDALTSFKPKSQEDTTYVVLPFEVLEELDRFRASEGVSTERGRNARATIHKLDDLRYIGSLAKGVPIEPNYIVQVADNTKIGAVMRKHALAPHPDNRILAAALMCRNGTDRQSEDGEKEIELVSNDTGLRVKADALGIEASDWQRIRAVKGDEIYKGYRTIQPVPDATYDTYTRLLTGPVKAEELGIESCFPNEYFRIKAANGDEVLARHKKGNIVPFAVYEKLEGKKKRVLRLLTDAYKYPIMGIHPRNWQQAFALDALLDDEILLVNLIGLPGTGKTLFAMATSLHKSMHAATKESEDLVGLVATCPITPIGKELGYLPGTEEEKMEPWTMKLQDHLHLLRDGQEKIDWEKSVRAGLIDIQPLYRIRGRTIRCRAYLIDDAQNVTPHEAKTMLTRLVGNGKMILTGDPDQIDHPHLTPKTNGILYVSERMKDTDISATVWLDMVERGRLASLAAQRL